jgi:hypothetical protein
MAIYQDLVEQFAFSHRYNSVKRFVRHLRRKDPKQYDRLEFLPGKRPRWTMGRVLQRFIPMGNIGGRGCLS